MLNYKWKLTLQSSSLGPCIKHLRFKPFESNLKDTRYVVTAHYAKDMNFICKASQYLFLGHVTQQKREHSQLLGTPIWMWLDRSLCVVKVHMWSNQSREKMCFFVNNGTEIQTICKLVLVMEVKRNWKVLRNVCFWDR